MNEEERRKEILLAEESIKRLYKEMALATGMADKAEAAREELEEANRAVGKAIEDLKSIVNTQTEVYKILTQPISTYRFL
jgi:hypothetical protein